MEDIIMLRLRPFRVPDAKTIITWQREPEEIYMWTAGIMGTFPVRAASSGGDLRTGE